MEQQLSDARNQELQPTAAQATTSADFSYEVIHNLIYILCPINKNDDGNADLDMDLPPDADESAAQATTSHEEEEIDVSFLFLVPSHHSPIDGRNRPIYHSFRQWLAGNCPIIYLPYRLSTLYFFI